MRFHQICFGDTRICPIIFNWNWFEFGL